MKSGVEPKHGGCEPSLSLFHGFHISSETYFHSRKCGFSNHVVFHHFWATGTSNNLYRAEFESVPHGSNGWSEFTSY